MIHVPKENLVRFYAQRHGIKVLVETGTLFGEMLAGVEAYFDTLYSIELSPDFFQSSKSRFEGHPKIHLFQGNSKDVLPRIMPLLTGPALFWLDAHYSGGTTAQGPNPIFGELSCIFNVPAMKHVVLIDDFRLFGSDQDFPTVEALESFIKEGWPDLDVTRLPQDDAFLIEK